MGAGSAGHAAPLPGRASSAPRERFSGGEAITASSFLFFAARRRSSTCRSPGRPGTERRERQERRRWLKGRAEREVRLRGKPRTAPTCPPFLFEREGGGGARHGCASAHAREEGGGRYARERRGRCSLSAAQRSVGARARRARGAREGDGRGLGRRRAEGGEGACGTAVTGGAPSATRRAGGPAPCCCPRGRSPRAGAVKVLQSLALRVASTAVAEKQPPEKESIAKHMGVSAVPPWIFTACLKKEVLLADLILNRVKIPTE